MREQLPANECLTKVFSSYRSNNVEITESFVVHYYLYYKHVGDFTESFVVK